MKAYWAARSRSAPGKPAPARRGAGSRNHRLTPRRSKGRQARAGPQSRRRGAPGGEGAGGGSVRVGLRRHPVAQPRCSRARLPQPEGHGAARCAERRSRRRELRRRRCRLLLRAGDHPGGGGARLRGGVPRNATLERDSPVAASGAIAGAPAPKQRRTVRIALDPLIGRAIDERHLLLYRTVLVDDGGTGRDWWSISPS